MATAPPRAIERRRLRITGVVQGVGFRPFVYRLASEPGLGGFVLNDGAGRAGRGRGRPAEPRRVRRRDLAARPRRSPGSTIGRRSRSAPTASAAFRIETSAGGAATRPRAGRHRHLRRLPGGAAATRRTAATATRSSTAPTAGPASRSSTRVPYDRAEHDDGRASRCATRCRAEYEDPRDRRFHAQPIACPDCGPAAPAGGRAAGDEAPSRSRSRCSRAGAIVAVKGLGGYHLACDAAERARRSPRLRAAQAPRGEAVRGDGRRARAAGRARAPPRSASCFARGAAPDRARAAARRTPRSRTRSRPARPARRDAPLHAAPPPALRRLRRSRW